MKIRAFTSLEELNAFLVEQGAEPMPQGVLDAGLAQAAAQAGVDPEELTASFKVYAEGDEAGEAPESVVSEDAFNSYVEFSSAQIARLTEERDEARAMVEQEINDHRECHEHMQEHIHQIRVQGYAEALAAGLFPGVPFERLDANHQEVLMRQAHADIEKVDATRAELNTPTKH